MSSESWSRFWLNQEQSFFTIMRISTSYLATQIEKHLQLNRESKILDYGCGPGFLADSLSQHGIIADGADINPYFIAQCKSNHPHSIFLGITTDFEDCRILFERELREKKFDVIVILSIVQYFKNESEVKALIKLLLPFLSKRGKIVIADCLTDENSSVRDALSLFYHCVKIGEVLAFLRFIVYLMFSDYRKLSNTLKLLKISKQNISEISLANGLSCREVAGLTIHPTRVNFILSKQ